MVDTNNQLFKDLTQRIEICSFSPITIKGINIQYHDIKKLEEKMQNLTKLVVDSINFSSSDSIYFLFFGINEIFILDDIIIKQNKDFLKSKSLEFLFYSDKCKNCFNNLINTEETIVFSPKTIQIQENKQIIIKITDFLITRSKNKTREMYQKMNYNSLKTRHDFKRSDFVVIKHLGYGVDLCFNLNDQLLYVLKCHDKNYDQDITFQREINFYESIGNKNKFISKFFGSIKGMQNYIIIEYVEGETLKDFILKNEISEMEEIKIILEIIFTVKYVHEKGFFLRDLKFDNIMIDSNKNAKLIDFDLTKESSDDSKNTVPVGSVYFSSPEQSKNKQYSFESDIFSLGMIIDFILTKKEYQQSLYDENGNILNFDIMKEKPSKYWDYKSFKFLILHCLKYSPESRLSIDSLIILLLNYLKINYPKISEMINIIESLYFYYLGMIEIPSGISNLKHCKKLANFDVLRNNVYNIYNKMVESKNSKVIQRLNIKIFNGFIKQIKNEACKEDPNTEIFNISESIDEKVIDKEYCFQNINEIILYLNEISCDHYLKSTIIQYELAKIYYENVIIQRDINKSISYFTLCANHGHILAQYHLGVIYIEGKYNSNDIDKAIHYFTLAANQNHKYAQFNLGSLYLSIDIQKSIHYFTLAAKQGFAKAYYNLGNIFYNGQYMDQDMNKAIDYYCRASDLNDINAQLQLGIIYDINKDIHKAIYYYSLAANQNNVRAQKILAEIYLTDKIIPHDINKAIYYISLAASQNDAKSLYNLGYYYDSGEYIAKDIKKAIYYYSLAADQNFSPAQYKLGLIYEKGEHIEKNINKAMKYFSLAANQNFTLALVHLAEIYSVGENVSVNMEKSIYYLKLAANQDHVNSQYCLGFLYLKGIHVSQDKEKAIHYLTLAADKNHIESQYILGTLYLQGSSISKNVEKGIHYLKRAADQNHNESQYNLGTFYFISKDIPKAIHFLTLAANQNNIDAQVNLGVLYSQNEFIQPDIDKAIHFLTLAANQNSKEAQYNLGIIYYGKNNESDINKAIYYFTLSAKQNYAKAQYCLGVLYSIGKYIIHDINQAIYYFTKAADQKIVEAYYNLGCLYFNYKNSIPEAINKSVYYFSLAADQNDEIDAQNKLGIIYSSDKYIAKDVNKSIYYFQRAASKGLADAQYNLGYIYFSDKSLFNPKKFIHYFSLAANQKNAKAQYFLGHFYLQGFFVKQNIFKGIDFLNLSAKNGNKNAHFILGFLYHEGKHIDRDIIKSLHYYKEVSSFNNNYAKNNLGILYKHGFNDKVPKIIDASIIYFEEAINQTNDKVSMYNLAHLYLYEESNEEYIDKSIDLLIKSINCGFLPSKNLLCLALIKKCGFNIEYIKETINKYGDESNSFVSSIYEMIQCFQLIGKTFYENYYNQYKTIDFLYNDYYNIIQSKSIIDQKTKQNQKKDPNIKNITNEFYEGFGIE